MTLEGWDHVPRGYGATFDVSAAPLWLRIWFRTPFLDRFAHPRMVERGCAYLTPMPRFPADQREEVGPGWRLRPEGHRPPGSETYLA